MIRVIYRWRVKAERRDEFVERWREMTNAIHRETGGEALGSFCLQGIENEDEILTIALWKDEAKWREFIRTAKAGSMSVLHGLGTQLSALPYRQLGDETVVE